MRGIKYVLIAAAAVVLFSSSASAPTAQAQVSVGIGIGVAPACPYGYYGYAPYRCAPYGYYGPEWFVGGGFVGAGPWHRDRFYGHVNRAYDPRFGYHGGYPEHGGYREPPNHWNDFHGTHYSDPRGHYHTEEQHGRYVR
jgi:hypothetical protein